MTASSIERIFSIFELVMSKIQYRLGLDKAKKLFLYITLRDTCYDPYILLIINYFFYSNY